MKRIINSILLFFFTFSVVLAQEKPASEIIKLSEVGKTQFLPLISNGW